MLISQIIADTKMQIGDCVRFLRRCSGKVRSFCYIVECWVTMSLVLMLSWRRLCVIGNGCFLNEFSCRKPCFASLSQYVNSHTVMTVVNCEKFRDVFQSLVCLSFFTILMDLIRYDTSNVMGFAASLSLPLFLCKCVIVLLVFIRCLYV